MHPKISTILSRIDLEREKNNTWNIDHETGVFLNSFVKKHKIQRVLEIGTSTGYSTLWFAEALQHTNGNIVTVESHAKRFEIARQHFLSSGLQNITQIKGHAPEILETIDGMFDLIFFDATKYEHVLYFKACEPRLNAHGFIITDNAISHKEELADYMSFVNKKQHFEHSVVDIGSGLMISKKLH